MSKTIKIIESSLQEAVIEYIEARDRLQCHIHLRITPSGECYVAEDAGYCISADEYNNEPDSEKTVLHQQGWGQHHLPDDWQQTEQSQEITSIIGYITEDLTLDGYDIEWVSDYDLHVHPVVVQLRTLCRQHNIPYIVMFGLGGDSIAMANDLRDELNPNEALLIVNQAFQTICDPGRDLEPANLSD